MSARMLARCRRLLKMTQAQLARRLGVSQVAVCHWEKGRSAPSPRVQRKLARVGFPISCA